jgi:predicted secreted Zn-dependent protease
VTIGMPVWSTWDLHASDLAGVVSAIEGMPEAGNTDWSHSAYTSHHGDSGAVESVDVTVEISVSLPHWVERDSAPHAEQLEFDRATAALHTHEQGHVDLVHTYLEHIDTHMVGGPESHAAQVWSETFHNLQAASDHYDAGNGHGVSEGTTITVPVATP